MVPGTTGSLGCAISEAVETASESIKNHKLIHNFLKIRVETLLKLLDGDSFFDYNEVRCLKNVNKLLFI